MYAACQTVSQIERPKYVPVQTLTTNLPAKLHATEINDQSKVPNEFIFPTVTVVCFVASIGM